MLMYRSVFGRRDRRPRPRSRARGCLLWIVLLIAILIVLSLLFGGFQKGTKAGSLASLTPLCTLHFCTSATTLSWRPEP